MSLRLFAALDVPDDVADRLIAIQRGVPGARWRPRDALHLTLRFFGDTPETVADDLDAELEQIGQRLAPFDLALRGAGFFGKETPHTLWIGAAANPALAHLAAECERAARRAGLKPETRKFAPHVTVAYLDGSNLERVAAFEQRHALFESRPWTIEGFRLFSSWLRPGSTSLYREEQAYPLLGSGG